MLVSDPTQISGDEPHIPGDVPQIAGVKSPYSTGTSASAGRQPLTFKLDPELPAPKYLYPKMKTVSVVASTALAIAAAEETCDYSVVKPYFHEIGDSMTACENATSINLQSGSVLSLSTDEQSEICNECAELVELVYTFTWYDCEIDIDGANQTLSTYYETLVGSCSNSSEGSSSSTATISTSSIDGTSTKTSDNSDGTSTKTSDNSDSTTATTVTAGSTSAQATTSSASGTGSASAASATSSSTASSGASTVMSGIAATASCVFLAVAVL